MMTNHRFSRRTMLRGLGVSMALPWLESRAVWGDEPNSRGKASTAPIRLGVFFAGNGFHSKEWWAKGTGSAMELGQVLAPLHDFRDRMLFVQGLYNEQAQKGNIHSSQTGNLLSGSPLASGGEIRSGTSVDQYLAATYGRSTKVPSLVLGCEKSNPSVHKNYSMLYSSHISWTSPTTPTPLELYPALAFDRLFKDEARRGDSSVLDAVLDDAGDLRRQVSLSDQRKLDEYLESVRDVERRIASAGSLGELQGWRPTLDKPNVPRPPDGIPQNIADHMRLMCDILVLGFQTDTTRITTLKLNNDHSSLRFPHLGVDYMIHHLLSHSGLGRLAQGQPVLRRAAGLRRGQARRDPGGRTHRAGQLDASVLLQHDERRPRRQPASRRHAGQGGRPDQDRPRARLSPGPEPADVPPLPVHDGQDGRSPRPVRRRQPAAWGSVNRIAIGPRFISPSRSIAERLARSSGWSWRIRRFQARASSGWPSRSRRSAIRR